VTLLAIDPGETVGWAIFDPKTNAKLDGGQDDWPEFLRKLAAGLEIGLLSYTRACHGCSPFEGVTEIVQEEFQIYPPDVGDGPPPYWDHVIVARVIGAVQILAELADVPVAYQGADIKFDALRAAAAEDFSRPLYENRHENDATMHGTYFLARRVAERTK
jgi:hypothetical protein